MRKLTAFPRSNNPISPYTFRFPLWSCQLEQACNLLWCFITFIFTPPHWLAINATSTFLCRHGIDPYIRGFRQLSCKHSNLGYFVDLRPIGSTVHLWTAFVGLVIIQQSIRLLSADFTELLTLWRLHADASRSISVSASGRYSLISLIGISVLQSFRLESPSTLCVSFSLTNVSHGYRCRSPQAD